MSFETWLAFIIAASIILVIPGPTILLVISHSIRYGQNAALPLIAGVAAGDLIAMTVSLAGLGVIMATSATLFMIFKVAGAMYLIYLGIKMWRSHNSYQLDLQTHEAPKSRTQLFSNAFLVTVLNPKASIFFIAFFPQFMNPAASHSIQLLGYGTTFITLAILNAALYAMFASRIRRFLRTPVSAKIFHRGGAAALVGAGLITLSARQS
ncbi:LysE family translocator [Gynuella sunshinyii]|uniref:Putative threonine efflux protein n=1 Tax=Gynuella sunshinyii YC6258 TaxID=1445510 RepID=A0A0C5VXH9_9GAMM|nr:LysE family translocator [Gynuella sunshinyii]AJQ95129.1 putative threonine efflux protein [Gynuella sunshinyii YC6258]